MEASSPLAALRAPSIVPIWGRNDLYASHPNAHFSSNLFGPGSFNFGDLSMKNTMKPNCLFSDHDQISSPTASLAADLSQNFHIDMSPQLPTPRRSLFTSNLLGSLDYCDSMTTPSVTSSRSGELHESMDISPLPHKLSRFHQAEILSPTPANTQNEKFIPSSPPLTTTLEAPRILNGTGPERRKSLLARSGLSKSKYLSSHALPGKKSENQIPPFRFGAGRSKLSTTTSISLGECFLESPPRDSRPKSANSPVSSNNFIPRLGKAFGGSNASSRLTGSPMGNSGKRASNPLIRPRKQFRRSLSMFEHPDEMINNKRDDSVVSNLHTVMDVDELQKPTLPHFFQEGNTDSIPRISQKTLLQVLDGEYETDFDQTMIVDCRFEYEFDGGHIDGAVNFNNKDLLASHLFNESILKKTLLIFHCEYSAHRAPIMARHIRKHDRTANIEQYPTLTFPEVYILDGGYSAFYAHHRNRCIPQNYVEMDDKDFAYTCEREMGRLRQNRAKFSRAQTFAFGQTPIDDSPTAPSRCRNTTIIDIEMNGQTPPKLCGRRLVSY